MIEGPKVRATGVEQDIGVLDFLRAGPKTTQFALKCYPSRVARQCVGDLDEAFPSDLRSRDPALNSNEEPTPTI